MSSLACTKNGACTGPHNTLVSLATFATVTLKSSYTVASVKCVIPYPYGVVEEEEEEEEDKDDLCLEREPEVVRRLCTASCSLPVTAPH